MSGRRSTRALAIRVRMGARESTRVRLTRLARLVALVACAVVASGHVGSPDVYFVGTAGPYPVRVVVRPPGVVPGRAEVLVQVTAPGVRRVTVRPVYWETSTGGAPAPDVARAVPAAPGTFAAQAWLMTSGSYSMEVRIEGTGGAGSVNVPVLSVAMRALPMSRALGITLVGLGAFLVVGLLSIIASAAREGSLEPGEEPDSRCRRRSRIIVGAGALVLLLALTGGMVWWSAWARDYANIIYKPLHVSTSIVPTDADGDRGGRTLHLAIADGAWLGRRRFTPLVRDHGKLMHLFLVRAPAMDAFAHLHPTTRDSNEFRVPLPALPPGTYFVYADIVHASGFAETLTDTVMLTDAPAVHAVASTPRTGARVAPDADPDDSWLASVAAERVARLSDGSTMTWDRGDTAIVAGRMAPLHFSVRAPDGRPATLEPYMGMASHAMIARDDGRVFVHLHPMGTIAMASQAIFDRRERGDTALAADATETMGMDVSARPGAVAFPYAFPQPGRYHIWVQVKRDGRVLTGAFETDVK